KTAEARKASKVFKGKIVDNIVQIMKKALIILFILAAVLLAGCSQSPGTGRDQNDFNGGSGGGTGGNTNSGNVSGNGGNGSGGSSSGTSGSTVDISSWCTQSRMGNGVGTVLGIEQYRGSQTCHTQRVVGPTTSDFYFISKDSDYWTKDTMTSPKGSFVLEKHMVGSRCTEYSCSSNPGDAKLSCKSILSATCATEVN
ncbi:MAG: hypothetical protein Q7R70_04125, partial [Candidatus Diapherotrites archaeon]|nr:hypothetical protein [Candidatus Diapherotrites archaeon]